MADERAARGRDLPLARLAGPSSFRYSQDDGRSAAGRWDVV
jgi:hypothetical protein